MAHKSYSPDRNRFFTPRYVIEALLKREEFEGTILEPACGQLSIVNALFDWGYSCGWFDIQHEPQQDCFVPTDFYEWKESYDCIISNGPYLPGAECRKFINHALAIARRKVALLLPGYSLEWASRFDKLPLKKVYHFNHRPQFFKPKGGKGGPNTGVAWFVWENEYRGEPTVEFVDDRPERELLDEENNMAKAKRSMTSPCPHCGHLNHIRRKICDKCGKLTKAGAAAKASSDKRLDEILPTEPKPVVVSQQSQQDEALVQAAKNRMAERSSMIAIADFIKAAQKIGVQNARQLLDALEDK